MLARAGRVRARWEVRGSRGLPPDRSCHAPGGWCTAVGRGRGGKVSRDSGVGSLSARQQLPHQHGHNLLLLLLLLLLLFLICLL